jgi:hypothetical protein
MCHSAPASGHAGCHRALFLLTRLRFVSFCFCVVEILARGPSPGPSDPPAAAKRGPARAARPGRFPDPAPGGRVGKRGTSSPDQNRRTGRGMFEPRPLRTCTAAARRAAAPQCAHALSTAASQHRAILGISDGPALPTLGAAPAARCLTGARFGLNLPSAATFFGLWDLVRKKSVASLEA